MFDTLIRRKEERCNNILTVIRVILLLTFCLCNFFAANIPAYFCYVQTLFENPECGCECKDVRAVNYNVR